MRLVLSGGLRTEGRRGALWNVRPVKRTSTRVYVCPGCAVEITVGTDHVVVWRADGVLGNEADLEGRRHWHSHCWKIW